MKFDILSLFPEYFQSAFSVSILKKAIDKKLLEINLTNIRDFSKDKHKKVDDRPFSGGPGMVLTCQPTIDAIRSVKTTESHVIYLTPQGRQLTSTLAEKLAKKKHLILLSGHYEGIDERVIESEVDEEISIGPYVLPNGCSAAIVLTEAISRYITGVLGNENAAFDDTFQNNGMFEGPQYTRPVEFEGKKVPDVFLSGNHLEIKKAKEKLALLKMKKLRSDLYFKHIISQKIKAKNKTSKNLIKGEPTSD